MQAPSPSEELVTAAVEQIYAMAHAQDLPLEEVFCLAGVPTPGDAEPIINHFSADDRDAFIAMDALGRVWLVECALGKARLVGPDESAMDLANDLISALGGFAFPEGVRCGIH